MFKSAQVAAVTVPSASCPMCSLQLHSPQALSSRIYSPAKFFSIPTTLNHNRKSRLSATLSFVEDFPSNAHRRKSDPQWRGGFSLGIDLGLSCTGLALSKGFSFRPLTVLKLRGEKLELRLLDIAEKEEADEFIIGLPKSWDGKETPQSNKVRSVAGRLAVRAAERGWRVYLQDEHGTSTEASSLMINMGLRKSARQRSTDAYAAAILLKRYFAASGQGTELVLPKQIDLLEKLRRGVIEDFDSS